MKTRKEWNQDIISITTKIRQDFPELSKYITEIPVNVSVSFKDEIDIKDLEDYYCTLKEVVNNYAKTHTGSKTTKNT